MSANAKAHTGFSRYDLAETVNPIRRLYERGTEWWQERRTYNQTLNELSALSDRDLADIGIARADISAIARETARSGRASH